MTLNWKRATLVRAMSTRMTITIDGTAFEGELNDSAIAQALAARLPAEVRMSRWGDEYYGAIGLGMENGAEAHDVVEIGELGYWPTGDALCIFFGPTPVSRGDEPRAASAVTVVGAITHPDAVKLREFGASVVARLSPA
jgi:hypothetical protein